MINVDIYVPSMDEVFDFQIDETVAVTQVINEITEILAKREKTEMNPCKFDFMLAALDEQRILPGVLSLKKCGIQNGSQLMLV